jgi:dihydropteroate synthase
VWSTRRARLSLDRPLLMGILNVTPDSFSDGGQLSDADAALRRAERMLHDGADLLDLGGESTRPGAEPVSAEAELRRVIPVLRLLRSRLTVPLSIDTRRAEVAAAALAEGADIVNDVSALGDPGMAEVVASTGAGLVLMHMRGTPATMQDHAVYGDVASEVTSELEGRLRLATAAGISEDRIVVDPGIGFAKTAGQNLELIGRMAELERLGRPILLGVSRKAFLGALLGGVPPGERVDATAAACVVGLLAGARIFRVHDIRPVRQALTVAEAIRAASDTSK